MTNLGHLHSSQTSWIQDKAAKEIKETTRTNVEEFANNMSEERLEKMLYLHASLNKTLKTYHAVPVSVTSAYNRFRAHK
ncbi:hypothetical protein L1987_73156 [Smallanthus sonchifolius]|uniref:Uncharacterized protein n=1 Tax=Smallanthus sonchifolius TaxID=185202 RepID=A0ACB9A0G1_9ASTR|nr:hypothetical protein L1987_73156 [Smallanthus sonchifolius]